MSGHPKKVFSGWLQLLAPEHRGTKLKSSHFKKRFCILFQGRLLKCYKDDEKQFGEEIISILLFEVRNFRKGVPHYYRHALGEESKHVLELVSPGHIFVLVAKSERDFKRWAQYLASALDNYDAMSQSLQRILAKENSLHAADRPMLQLRRRIHEMSTVVRSAHSLSGISKQLTRAQRVLCAEVCFALSATRAYLLHFQASLRLHRPAPEVSVIKLPMNTENKMLQGTITLRGDHITATQLTAHFPRLRRYKTTGVNLSIKQQSPWVVEQLVAVRTLLEDALFVLPSPNQPVHSSAAVIEIMTKVMQYVERINTMLACPPTPPHLAATGHPGQVFEPPLPSDIVAEFVVRHVYLVACVCVLEKSSTPGRGIRTMLHHKEQVEVVEVAAARYPIKGLRQAMAALVACMELCNTTLQNVNSFLLSNPKCATLGACAPVFEATAHPQKTDLTTTDD